MNEWHEFIKAQASKFSIKIKKEQNENNRNN